MVLVKSASSINSAVLIFEFNDLANFFMNSGQGFTSPPIFTILPSLEISLVKEAKVYFLEEETLIKSPLRPSKAYPLVDPLSIPAINNFLSLTTSINFNNPYLYKTFEGLSASLV